MYAPQQRSAETENEDAISVRYKANHLYDMASHLYDIANHLTSRMSTPRPFCCSSGWTGRDERAVCCISQGLQGLALALCDNAHYKGRQESTVPLASKWLNNRGGTTSSV
jgi:hypothetical protein